MRRQELSWVCEIGIFARSSSSFILVFYNRAFSNLSASRMEERYRTGRIEKTSIVSSVGFDIYFSAINSKTLNRNNVSNAQVKNAESEWVFSEGMDGNIRASPGNIICSVVQELVSVTFISVAQNSLHAELLHSLSAEEELKKFK